MRLGTRLEEALRAEVEFGRLKKHYFDEDYNYQSSMTPDATDVARRASTMMLLYQWQRGLFEVQYEGMSLEERTRVRPRYDPRAHSQEERCDGGVSKASLYTWERTRARTRALACLRMCDG